MKKILIACAGSGGHFYPGLSLTEGFQSKFEKVFVSVETGKKRSQSQKKILKQKRISYFNLNSPPLPKSKFGILIFLILFAKEFLKAVYFILKYRIDCVLVMGSFANAAVAVAGLVCFKKIYLHESNIVLGKANRFLIQYATKIFSVFPFWEYKNIQHEKWLQKEKKKLNFKEKFVEVKLPLRKEILNFFQKKNTKKNEKIYSEIYNQLGLKKTKKTIFLFGGSQGAEKVNEVFIEFLENLSSKDWQIIHLTGQKNNDEYKKMYEKNKFNFFIVSHFEEIGKCYLIADIVICRSGASTLSEIDFFNKKTILIPYPWAIYQHQYHNAVYFAKQCKNILVLEQKNLTVKSLEKNFNLLSKIKFKSSKLSLEKNNEYLAVVDKIFEKIV